MAIKIPDSERDRMAKFLALSPEDAEELFRALKDAKPSLSPNRLAASLAVPGLGADSIKDSVTVLVSLHWARGHQSKTPGTFASDVVAALKDTGAPRFVEPADGWTAFQERLARLLSLNRSLGVTSKALSVAYDFPRHYHQARVLTDARPVFADSPSEAPAAFIVQHTLKIEIHEDGEEREWFVAMNLSDLRELKVVVDRALEKNQSLTKLLEKTEIPILSWESADD